MGRMRVRKQYIGEAAARRLPNEIIEIVFVGEISHERLSVLVVDEARCAFDLFP